MAYIPPKTKGGASCLNQPEESNAGSCENNVAENAIRPFVLGRKHWLFAGHPDRAAAGAVFFSLIETAKANGLEPFGYLRHIFERLPLIANPDGYRSLLPWALDRATLNCRP